MIFILYLSIDQGTEVNLSVVSNFLGSLHKSVPGRYRLQRTDCRLELMCYILVISVSGYLGIAPFCVQT